MPYTIAANRLLSEKIPYPLHLGITEAGTKWSGSLKSAVGLGTLLADGIGDTIRISLSTFHAEEEVKVAWEILKALKLREKGPVLIACPTCGRLQFDMDTVVADIEERLRAYEDPVEVAVLGCAVNGIGEASHADFGITGAKNEGLIFSRGKALKKVPQEQLVDALFAEIDKYAKTKKIEVDATEQQEGAAWLERIEEENAGELTPERLAKLEAEKARADADAMDEVLKPRLDEADSPTDGRRFTRGREPRRRAARGLRRARALPVEVVAELSAAIEADPHGAFWATCLERADGRRRARRRRHGRAATRGRWRACRSRSRTSSTPRASRRPTARRCSAATCPARDAEAVRRVRAAGAIVLGKTATHEFAWGFSSINDALGTVRNPRDPERVAGGSSGGSGAALAAGLAPLALGHRHGRLDPRPERVLRGLRAQADVGAGRASTASGRSRARSTTPGRWRARRSDLALLLGVLAPRAAARRAGTPPRVAVCPDLHGAPLEPQLAAAHAELGLRLGAGEVRVPGGGADRARVPRDPARRGPRDPPRRRALARARGRVRRRRAPPRARWARRSRCRQLLAAHADRETVRAAFARLFEHADVLLTPAVPLAPPRIEDERADPALREAVLAYTAPQDLVGLPAVRAPERDAAHRAARLRGAPGGRRIVRRSRLSR